MELASRGCLKNWMAKKKRSVNIGLVARDVAKGLQHLHKANLIHRDIAARNILLSDESTAMLSDFGLSRTVGHDNSSYYKMDQQLMLPLRWMAPESLYLHKFTKKSDVWMFGILLWEIITECKAKPYHDVQNPNEIIIGVYMERLSCKKSIPQSTVASLKGLIEKCLEHDPDKRPSSEELVKLTKALHDEHPMLVYPPAQQPRVEAKRAPVPNLPYNNVEELHDMDMNDVLTEELKNVRLDYDGALSDHADTESVPKLSSQPSYDLDFVSEKNKQSTPVKAHVVKTNRKKEQPRSKRRSKYY